MDGMRRYLRLDMIDGLRSCVLPLGDRMSGEAGAGISTTHANHCG